MFSSFVPHVLAICHLFLDDDVWVNYWIDEGLIGSFITYRGWRCKQFAPRTRTPLGRRVALPSAAEEFCFTDSAGAANQ